MNKILKAALIMGGILAGGCLLLAGYAVMSNPKAQLNIAQPRAQIVTSTQQPVTAQSTAVQVGPSPQPTTPPMPTAIPPTAPPEPTQPPPVQLSGKLVENCPVSRIYKPKEGKVLLGVNVTLKNGSNETLDINPLDFSAVDTEGFVYSPELASCDEQMELQKLNPGQAIRGMVGFHVPPNTKLVQIQYRPTLFDNVKAIGNIE